MWMNEALLFGQDGSGFRFYLNQTFRWELKNLSQIRGKYCRGQLCFGIVIVHFYQAVPELDIIRPSTRGKNIMTMTIMKSARLSYFVWRGDFLCVEAKKWLFDRRRPLRVMGHALRSKFNLMLV